MALSRIDTTNMIEDVPQSKIDNNINFRNIIINGGMDLAQRGTSTSSITSTGYYTAEAEVNAKIQELKDAETNAETKKASGKQKLKDLGLDDAEIKALIG